MDVSPNTEKLLDARLAHIEEHHTFQSKRALGKVLPDALPAEAELARDQLHLRKARRKVRFPIPLIPRYLFGTECEDGRNRSHQIRHGDDGDCSRLEHVPGLEHGDDDALSEIRNETLIFIDIGASLN